MDQGLKERLIGAAVLVVLGVLVIPWILDGRGAQQESSASALRLPAPEEAVPVRTETIEIGGPAEPASPPSPTPSIFAEQHVAVADVALETKPPESTTPAIAPAVAEGSTGAEAERALPQATGEAVAARSAGPAPTLSAAKPKAVPAPKPAAAAGAGAKGAWTVQLGSFGAEANARREAQRVGGYGYKAAVSSHKAGGKTLYRVRVGSYDNRAEAGATASSLSAHGFTAQVVAAD